MANTSTKKLNYFYIPNRAFDYGLSANEISVLAVIYACAKDNIVRISQKTIAGKLGIKKEETVSRCIRKLSECGFIFATKRPVKAVCRLGVTVYYLLPINRSEGYFKVDRRVVLDSRLKPSHLRVYLFICKAVKSCTRTMWNSYNDIAYAIKSTRSAVVKIIADLVNLKLIKKLRVKDKHGAFSDNHYMLCDFKEEKHFKKRKWITGNFRSPVIHSSISPLIATTIGSPLPIGYLYDTTGGFKCQGRKRVKRRDCCKYFFNRGSP